MPVPAATRRHQASWTPSFLLRLGIQVRILLGRLQSEKRIRTLLLHPSPCIPAHVCGETFVSISMYMGMLIRIVLGSQQPCSQVANRTACLAAGRVHGLSSPAKTAMDWTMRTERVVQRVEPDDPASKRPSHEKTTRAVRGMNLASKEDGPNPWPVESNPNSPNLTAKSSLPKQSETR